MSKRSYELSEALSRLIHSHPFFAVILKIMPRKQVRISWKSRKLIPFQQPQLMASTCIQTLSGSTSSTLRSECLYWHTKYVM